MIEFDVKRYEQCRLMPEALAPLAASQGIALSPDAQHMQRLVFGIGALLDDTMDQGAPDEELTAFQYWKDLSQGQADAPKPDGVVLPQLIADLGELHSYMTLTQANIFYQQGRTTACLTNQTKQALTPAAYHAARADEARNAFEMAVGTIPEPEQRHPNFLHYVHLGGIIGAMAGAVDGVSDLRQDSRQGRTLLRPTFAAYRQLSRLALAETRFGLKEIGLQTTLQLAGRASAVLAKDYRQRSVSRRRYNKKAEEA